MTMSFQHILKSLPYAAPFLFVDGLSRLDANGAEGYFTFQPEMDFYQGHFKENPVTPGVILTECCAQIGLVCLGLHLLNEEHVLLDKARIGFSSSEMEFLKPVFPGEKVTVISKKNYFRFHKLKCEVKMYDTKGDLVCKGILAGMLTNNKDG